MFQTTHDPDYRRAFAIKTTEVKKLLMEHRGVKWDEVLERCADDYRSLYHPACCSLYKLNRSLLHDREQLRPLHAAWQH
jgi:hypothetical protein